MAPPIAMDEPCPCGSGELYRDCCGHKVVVKRRQRRNLIIGVIVLAAAAIPSFMYLYHLDQEKRQELILPPGSTYSEEHHHWHDADGHELKIPGYVWSMTLQKFLKITPSLVQEIEAEDQRDSASHYTVVDHPATQMPTPVTGVPQPDEPTPDGKVWSPEHGHYHDADSN